MNQSTTLSQDQDASYFETVNNELANNPKAGQRDFASSLNMSLGTTNDLIKRLCGKGWLCMKKLNSRTVHYLVTPEGLNVLAHRSYNYLRRTLRMIKSCQNYVNEEIQRYKEEGINKVVIQRGMDAGFLFEGACTEKEVPFIKLAIEEIKESCSNDENTLFVVEENEDSNALAGLLKQNSKCCSAIGMMKDVR
jgi:predicted transcriptional regulator